MTTELESGRTSSMFKDLVEENYQKILIPIEVKSKADAFAVPDGPCQLKNYPMKNPMSSTDLAKERR